MSNWDRLAVMELFEVIQRAKLDAQTSELQKNQLEALVQRFGHKAKTIDVHSEDVRALRDALCQICNLGPQCLLGANQCSKAREIG